MSKYHEQSVRILIDKESELYEKLVARAEKDGKTVAEVVDVLLTLGSYGILERRLDAMERMEKERKDG